MDPPDPPDPPLLKVRDGGDDQLGRIVVQEALQEASKATTLAWAALVSVALWLGKRAVEQTCEVVWSWLHIFLLFGVFSGILAFVWVELKRARVTAELGVVDSKELIRVARRLVPMAIFSSFVFVLFAWPAGELGVEPGGECSEKEAQEP